ncbi:MAG: outer membrane beta-barrel protein [Bacteroidales bacterium]|nr:outer membrane beta-barrel protein [Bacteroidales bacterium]
MKKVLLIVASLLLGMQAHAQLAVEGGYMHAFENSKGSVLNMSVSNSRGWDGFYAGARYTIGLDNVLDGFSVDPGANVSFLWTRFADNLKGREIAINVPIHAVYSLDIMSDVKVRFLAGPTLQLGLLNNIVDRSNNATTTHNMYRETLLGSARTPFNLYLGLGAGLEVAQMIRVNLGFDFGLLNLTTATNASLHRNVLKIGVGYIF